MTVELVENTQIYSVEYKDSEYTVFLTFNAITDSSNISIIKDGEFITDTDEGKQVREYFNTERTNYVAD